MNLREEIAVFEKRLGCRVAFHDLTGEITKLLENFVVAGVLPEERKKRGKKSVSQV